MRSIRVLRSSPAATPIPTPAGIKVTSITTRMSGTVQKRLRTTKAVTFATTTGRAKS